MTTAEQCDFYSDGSRGGARLMTRGVYVARCAYVVGHGGDCRFPNRGEDLSPEIRLRVALDHEIRRKKLEEPVEIVTIGDCLAAIDVAIDRALEHADLDACNLARLLHRRGRGLGESWSLVCAPVGSLYMGAGGHFVKITPDQWEKASLAQSRAAAAGAIACKRCLGTGRWTEEAPDVPGDPACPYCNGTGSALAGVPIIANTITEEP